MTTTTTTERVLSTIEQAADAYIRAADEAEELRTHAHALSRGSFRGWGFDSRAEALEGADRAIKAAKAAETACRRLRKDLAAMASGVYRTGEVTWGVGRELSAARRRAGGAHRPPEGKRTH